jgi:CheY-like chemotaxis protein
VEFSGASGEGSDMSLRIVLIDDDDDARELLSMLLGSDGHAIVEAATGAEGLAAVREHAPDLVLVDLDLPDVSGLDVARELRAEGSRVHLVALTGRAHHADRSAAIAAGFDHHATKPVDLASLRAYLSERTRSA